MPISRPLDGLPTPVVNPSWPRKRKFSGLGMAFILLMLLVAGGAAAYMVNPNLPSQIVAWVNTSVAPGTPVPAATETLMAPPTAADTPTPEFTLTPTATEIILPSLTPTPTETPLPTETATITPLPTPIGGGAGTIAFVSDRSGVPEIYLINVDGSGLRQITDFPDGACQPEWSPDGLRLIFISPCSKNLEAYYGSSMFTINADGTNLFPLPVVPGGDFDPVWSPDGNTIAFTSLRSGTVPQIFLLDLRDNSVTSLLDPNGKANSQPAWSPDGRMLAYIGNDGRIWAMHIDGTNRHALSVGGGNYNNNNPKWSPDGTTVIFTRRDGNDPTSRTQLMAVQYTENGAVPTEVSKVEMVSEMYYSPDGYWIVLHGWFTGNHDIYIMRSSGVDRRTLVENDAYDFDPSWRPVGNQP